jgi:hypothetical protein
LLLDEDGEVLLSSENLTHENMLAGFLARAKQSAQAQDMELLSRMLDTCYAKYTSNKGIAKYQHHHKDYTEVAREWKENLEWTIQTIGWTAHGQTNTLLPNFIAYGVVFLGLKGEELKDCLYELILAAPGYHEYCRHQHEIKTVIKGWVENTERQGYYLEYCGFPARSGLNPHIAAKHIKATRNHHNDNLAKRTEQRLNAILAALTEIPTRVKAKIAAIQTKSVELFGEAISRNTLYKSEYKPLWFSAEIAKLDSNSTKHPTPPTNYTTTLAIKEPQPINSPNQNSNTAPQNQSQTELSHTPPLYETYVGRVQGSWLHHQLQLHCINSFCQSILDLQFLDEEPDLEPEQDRSNLPNLPNFLNLQSTSVALELQNSPIQNIHNTEDFNDDSQNLQPEEMVEIINSNESSFELIPYIDFEPDSDPLSSIEIGTKLRRNVQQIGLKIYPALANCQVVSVNGLDWVVRDNEGASWNVSHHALTSGVWEIEPDPAVVERSGVRSVVEIACQMRVNLGAIPDALLLEFLHHPELEAILAIIELANGLVAADSSELVAVLVADLSHCQKLDLWGVLSVDERVAVEVLMARPKSMVGVVEDASSGSVGELVVGVTVSTLTGLFGVVKHVFQSVAKPFLVHHESLGRTILYEGDALRLVN